MDRHFGVLDSDLRGSPPPPICLVIECPPGAFQLQFRYVGQQVTYYWICMFPTTGPWFTSKLIQHIDLKMNCILKVVLNQDAH